MHPREWYAAPDVELRLGAEVTGIDPATRLVTAGGHQERYDRLLLATGAHARHLPTADMSGAPVVYLRTIEDSAGCARCSPPGSAWPSSAEAGSVWRSPRRPAAGSRVTVLESAELPLLPVLGPEVAARFATLHREHGVDLRTHVTVEAIEERDGMAVVRLADGSAVEADLVLVGIGAVPNTSSPPPPG